MRIELLSNVTLATLLGVVILSALKRRSTLQEELDRANAELEVEKKKREADRAGRIRAETSLRKMVLAGTSQNRTTDEVNDRQGNGASGASEVQGPTQVDSNTSQGSTSKAYGMTAMEMSPIGLLRSCYRKRFGTPRQGTVVAGGRGTLKMFAHNNPLMSCSNLEEFSHVWLIYIFHENTNLASENMAGLLTALQTRRKPGNNPGVKSKVRPPRLGGEKVGLFATRTPHRPNAIGLSLVKLDRVSNGVLFFSGLDLIDGTPVLDVKPYIPASDSIPPPLVRQAEWLSDPVVKSNSDAVCLADARAQLEHHVRDLEFYDSFDDAWAAIREVLLCDIRSLHMRETASEAASAPNFHFDNVLVYFRCHEQQLVEVTKFELCRVPKPSD